MKKMFLLMAVGLFLVACQLFNKPGYYGTDGKYHPPEKGVFTLAGEGVKSTGLPWTGLIGTMLGAIGGIGGAVKHRKNTANGMSTVKLLGQIKTNLESVISEADFNKLIMKFAGPDSGQFGKWLAVLHDKMKEKKIPTK